MEQSSKSTSDILEMCRRLIRNWHGKNKDQITIMLGPSGPQRCSEELLVELHKLAKDYDLGIHTHYVETKLQAITALKRYDKTMGEYLRDLDILDDRWSLAHTVWVSDHEMDILRDKKATVVHNAASNLRLGSGIAPIIDLKERNVPIAIGTDSCNCGGNLSMFQSMSLAANLSKVTTENYDSWLHSSEVLNMATEGSAKAMRMENEIGDLAVGKRADIVLLDLGTTYLTPQINLVNQLVYSETGQSVDTVIIQGKIIMKNKKILTFNEEKIIKLAQNRYERIKGRIEELIEDSRDQIEYVEEVYKEQMKQDLGFHRSAPWN